MVAKAIVTDTYLEADEIKEHLKNVEYIILATPAPSKFEDTPIQFTIFLNTPDELPSGIKEQVFEKFLQENKIFNPKEVMSQVMPVGFGKSQQETPMPLLLIKPEDQKSIPNTPMHVIDFLADAEGFNEVKNDKLTGWSYAYDE